MVIFLSAVRDGEAAGCPAKCSCSTVNGYVNSRTVKCSFLGLSDIPAVLNSSTLHTLDLSNNELSILKNASFSSYSSLCKLILSNNNVEEIEINAFAGLQMMRDLDLRYNDLKSFNPEIFSANPVLENVSLQGNPIAIISPDSPILISTSISYLDLSSCSLTSVNSVTFSRLPSLYTLDLSSNLLQTISITTFEKLPDLRVLKLNNNRWKCNCDISEVMQWLTVKITQAPAHKPVKCLEGQSYRKFWTAAGGSKPCSVSTTAEAIVVTPVTSEAEPRTSPKSETEGGASLLSWNINTLCVFVILPITLGVAVFLSLIAAKYITKKCTFRPSQHEIQRKDGHLVSLFSLAPLLKPKLTADHTHHPRYVNRSSDSFGSAQHHVYEQID
jgi:hypothetical protein